METKSPARLVLRTGNWRPRTTQTAETPPGENRNAEVWREAAFKDGSGSIWQVNSFLAFLLSTFPLLFCFYSTGLQVSSTSALASSMSGIVSRADYLQDVTRSDTRPRRHPLTASTLTSIFEIFSFFPRLFEKVLLVSLVV